MRVTSKHILVENEHLIREDAASYCRTYRPLLRNTMTWLFQSLKNTCESKDIHGAEEYVSHGFNDIQNTDLYTVRLSVTSWPPLAVQCLCSIVFIAYHF